MVRNDQDSLFTGYVWTAQLLLEDGLHISYALRGANDNPEMEFFNGRLNGEGHSSFLEGQTLTDLRVVVGQRMDCYNCGATSLFHRPRTPADVHQACTLGA